MGDSILGCHHSHHDSSLVHTKIPITPQDFQNLLLFKRQLQATHSHEDKAKNPARDGGEQRGGVRGGVRVRKPLEMPPGGQSRVGSTGKNWHLG